MSDLTLAALVAAGVRYNRSDFADPHLDGPTALTITADGRVFGHLASWNMPHIGMGRRTTPPRNSTNYKYFHQGIVSTPDGDLPVGKITLGTGHAPIGTGITADAAAAHYDNTGAVVAAVRAGEDDHGIWLAGRVLPGTAPERVDELRLAGVSGDWRGIDGRMELVAALAVNVPGFPLPRTEELVAAGAPVALVAAGMIAPPAPPTADEVEAMVAAAVDARLREDRAVERRRAAAVAKVEGITASVVTDRRARVAGEVERVQAARACDDLGALTAAADSGVTGHLPRDLRRYWTKGAGLNRWSTSPHPYTALTRALRSELPPKAQHMVNGLAANLFKDVFGIYPGQRKELTAAGEGASGPVSFDRVRISRGGEYTDVPLGAVTAAGGGKRVRTQEGANRFGVSIGDLVPEAQQLAGDFAEAAGNDVANFIDPKRNAPKPEAGVSSNAKPTNPPAPTAKPEESGETFTLSNPSDPKTPPEKPSKPAAKPEKPQATGNVSEKPMSSPPKLDASDEPDTSTPSDQIPADAPEPRIDTGAGMDHPMLEDESPLTGAKGGELVSFGDGIAEYDDGTWTDGTRWGTGPVPGADVDDATFTADDGLDPYVDDFGEDVTVPTPGETVTGADVPPRLEGDGPLEEDQAPLTGAHGGQLVEFTAGVAFYDDGTDTDGTVWRYSEPYEDPEEIAASAVKRARVMRALGYVVPNRRIGGGRPKA